MIFVSLVEAAISVYPCSSELFRHSRCFLRKRFATVWSLVLGLSVLVPVIVENLQESDELILDVGHDEIS